MYFYAFNEIALLERSLNENAKRLLRQYWQKITDFKTVTFAQIISVIEQLNKRPRKTFQVDMYTISLKQVKTWEWDTASA